MSPLSLEDHPLPRWFWPSCAQKKKWAKTHRTTTSQTR